MYLYCTILNREYKDFKIKAGKLKKPQKPKGVRRLTGYYPFLKEVMRKRPQFSIIGKFGQSY
jgi:hypothetical protein